jgi:hypothetical protein
VTLRSDPNANYPRRPTVPPGTPPPLLQRIDPQSGRRFLEPVLTSGPAPVDAENFVLFRTGQFDPPPACCVCLSSPQTSFTPVFKVNTNDGALPVPLCAACAASIKMRWFLWALAGIVGGMIVAGLMALFIPGLDLTGRWIVFTLFSFFLSLLALVILPGRRTRPYRLKVVDGDRGIFRFSAINPQFNTLLAERVLLSERKRTALSVTAIGQEV